MKTVWYVHQITALLYLYKWLFLIGFLLKPSTRYYSLHKVPRFVSIQMWSGLRRWVWVCKCHMSEHRTSVCHIGVSMGRRSIRQQEDSIDSRQHSIWEWDPWGGKYSIAVRIFSTMSISMVCTLQTCISLGFWYIFALTSSKPLKGLGYLITFLFARLL